MLHRYPCRMVEVVGWVASVDDKLDKLFITRTFLPLPVLCALAESPLANRAVSCRILIS